MSLTTRLSVFFLAALALVLTGFSATLYLLASTYLDRQLDERLQRALDTLEAAVDIETGGLEWEPSDRKLLLGVSPGPEEVRWTVRDGAGVLVDRSANAGSGSFPIGWTPQTWPAASPDGTAFAAATGWRLAGRRLRLDELLRQGRGHPNDEPGYEAQYKVLVLAVGLMPAPLEATLGRLGLVLALLTAGIWVSSAVAGHWLCLRALVPLRRMANAAGAMTPADPGWRLPAPGTGDELDELGRAFNGLLERLHEAFGYLSDAYERQRRFAGDASHQLRTPLAALLGQVQIARRRDRSPEEYRRVLNVVQAEGTRLRQIVDTLLFLAQPDGSSLPTEPIDLALWVPDHLQGWSAHPRAPDLCAEVADDPPAIVRVQPTLLVQLLDNLLENAFKYSVPGTPVVVRAWREQGSVALAVEDHGCGLSAEDAAHVFEPFFRTERARRGGQPGVGLGLAVARQIAATLGGTLSVRSEPGKGSAFVLRLPEDKPFDTEEQMVKANHTLAG